MNWRQMKDFCDSLSPEQLEKKVVIWREEEAISDIEPITLSEDYYSEDYSEGCVPESDALRTIKLMPQDYPDGLGHFDKVYEKGHPILMEDF